jgi:hypothetical protein
MQARIGHLRSEYIDQCVRTATKTVTERRTRSGIGVSKECVKSPGFGFVDRHHITHHTCVPYAESDVSRTSEIAGDAKAFRLVTGGKRKRGEVLDDLEPLDCAAPRAEPKAFVERRFAAHALPHLRLLVSCSASLRLKTQVTKSRVECTSARALRAALSRVGDRVRQAHDPSVEHFSGQSSSPRMRRGDGRFARVEELTRPIHVPVRPPQGWRTARRDQDMER